MSIAFTFPGRLKSPNEILGRHWSVKHKERNRLFLEVFAAIRKGKVDYPMNVRVTQFRWRMLDPDNLVGSCKPLLDALKGLGWLVDDRAKWCTLHVEQRKPAPGAIEEVRLELEKVRA